MVTKSGLVEAWSLYDMVSEQLVNGIRFQSVKSLNMVDCQERRIGILNDIYYSKQAGKGDVVYNGAVSFPDVKWQYIPPKSMSELKFELICDIAKAMRRKR